MVAEQRADADEEEGGHHEEEQDVELGVRVGELFLPSGKSRGCSSQPTNTSVPVFAVMLCFFPIVTLSVKHCKIQLHDEIHLHSGGIKNAFSQC